MDKASGPFPADIETDDHRGRSTQRHARNLFELTTLYEQRHDLRGVSKVADFFHESVHWSI